LWCSKQFADRIIGIAGGSVNVDTYALNLTRDAIEAIYGPSRQAARKSQWRLPELADL